MRHPTFVCRKTENIENLKCICGRCDAENLRAQLAVKDAEIVKLRAEHTKSLEDGNEYAVVCFYKERVVVLESQLRDARQLLAADNEAGKKAEVRARIAEEACGKMRDALETLADRMHGCNCMDTPNIARQALRDTEAK